MQARKVIMMVDDSAMNLKVGKKVLEEAYEVYTVPSGEKLFMILGKKRPDLILLDVEMPEMDGYEVIRRLKADPAFRDIPVIFLTALADAGSELEGLSLGAIDYITKPFSPPLLMKRLETHLLMKDYRDNLEEMVEEKTKTVYELQNAVLRTVAELVECRDDVTGGHIERTQAYIRILIEEMMARGVYSDITGAWNTDFLIQSSQLHDVGKIAIKDSILSKPGKLTPEEFDVMKTHTTFGAEVIERIQENTTEHDFLNHARVFALTHHEKWDGSGYPCGLAGEEIPLQGRLMAIADVYDALISARPYKSALPHERAVEIILGGRGSHFDPSLVDIFLDVAERFQRLSELSDG